MHVGEVLDPINRQLSFWLISFKDANIIDVQVSKTVQTCVTTFSVANCPPSAM